MTSARIVTPGQAIAMIPTMTARMPSRIKEVEVDLNMKAFLSLALSAPRHLGSPRRLLCPGDVTAAGAGQHLLPMAP